jgi:2-phospho-L-lactate guanylyltransferase
LRATGRLVQGVDAIVPVNVLGKSKARLARILTPAQRNQISLSMLSDVLSVLGKVRRIRSIVVVSADRGVRSTVKRFHAHFLWEGERRGLNKGVRLAVKRAEREEASAVLVIHSDLPLLKRREINSFLRESKRSSVVLTPSRDGGTNALFLNPPTIIKPAFGPESFRKHIELAKKRKAHYKVVKTSGICFDVDEPRDLKRLMRSPQLRNETSKFLRGLKEERRR